MNYNWIVVMRETANTPEHRPTVFVVDDEVLLLDLAEALLTPLGCNVRKFANPEDALREFPQAAPVVVVTDYAMGRMNGMDLIRECRRLNPRQKTILISGTVDGEVFAGAPVRPDAFVAKPYDISQLVSIVREMIAAASQN
jgi:DNA-binding NtrC family response regulator